MRVIEQNIIVTPQNGLWLQAELLRNAEDRIAILHGVFHDLLPVEALKLSFRACLRNIMPFLVYSLIILVMMMPLAVLAQVMGSLAIIPLGLTLLVVIPTIVVSITNLGIRGAAEQALAEIDRTEYVCNGETGPVENLFIAVPDAAKHHHGRDANGHGQYQQARAQRVARAGRGVGRARHEHLEVDRAPRACTARGSGGGPFSPPPGPNVPGVRVIHQAATLIKKSRMATITTQRCIRRFSCCRFT